MFDLAAVNVCFIFRQGVFFLVPVLIHFVGEFRRPSYECP
jgi:hypothetical protein